MVDPHTLFLTTYYILLPKLPYSLLTRYLLALLMNMSRAYRGKALSLPIAMPYNLGATIYQTIPSIYLLPLLDFHSL